MPTRQRVAVSSETSFKGRGPAPPPSTLFRRFFEGAPAVAPGCGASTRVFHELHRGHRPNQRGDSPPHAVQ
jgi:hypothetical protein